MEAESLTGLWEFVGLWDEERGGPVAPAPGTGNAALREFLFFGADGAFFFAKYPRDETLYFDVEAGRFACAKVDGVLLHGSWRLEGNQLIESASQRGETSARQQAFEIDELSSDRLIVKEPAGDGTTFLKAVYTRGDVEDFPAPPLIDNNEENVSSAGASGADESSDPARYAEETARVQAEQGQIEALLAAGKRNSAHRLAQRSVRHSERVFGADHPNTAGCLCTLGACLVKLGESKAAVAEMERAKRIYEDHFGPHDLLTAIALNNLAPAYRDEREFRAAVGAARDAVRIRLAELGVSDARTATSVQNLGLALSGLGLLPEAGHCYFAAEAMFKDALGDAHPRARAARQNAQRLAEAVERDARFVCELLPEPGAADIEMAMLAEILDMCDVMLEAESASDLFTLAYGRAAHTESYIHLISAIRGQQRLIATRPANQAIRLQHLRDGQRRVRASVRAPVGSFSGCLKRIDRGKLGPISQVTLQHVFPNFVGNLEQAQQRDATLREYGIDPHAMLSFTEQKRQHAALLGYETKWVERQFRRFSGENNLPSQRYWSVCLDASGDDGQTLCRELFEYTDLRIPGLVFVSDTSDAALMKALTAIGMPQPLVHGILVFLLPPPENDQRRAYHHLLGPVLSTLHGPQESARDKWDGLSIVFIPTELSEISIDEVVDLRQPAAQEWLFRFFKDGDGAVSIKTAETPITGFAGMLPSLIYPEYGGSGVTKCIGSWMRSVGIQGLVFPSARSNASIEVDKYGAVRAFHGWNFVDYRDTELVPDTLIHLDYNDWYGFVAGRQGTPVLKQNGRSWALDGVEQRYDQTRLFMMELLATGAHF
jgi:tetratricopeptide (TPR) repeat protein